MNIINDEVKVCLWVFWLGAVLLLMSLSHCKRFCSIVVGFGVIPWEGEPGRIGGLLGKRGAA